MCEALGYLGRNWGWAIEAAMLAGAAAALVIWAKGGVLQVVSGCAWYALARFAGAGWLAVLGPAVAAVLVGRKKRASAGSHAVRNLDELTSAAAELSKRRSGAVIAIERTSPLSEYLASGTRLDAAAGKDLLRALFAEGSPLKNGAAVVRGGRVEAAGCLLPLSENPDVSKSLGTRHRAALGVSERTDAVAVVVSGETGAISVALKGDLMQGLSVDDLKHVLADLFEA